LFANTTPNPRTPLLESSDAMIEEMSGAVFESPVGSVYVYVVIAAFAFTTCSRAEAEGAMTNAAATATRASTDHLCFIY
jgi:hypothetical protein